LNRII